jgi:hypothetical protein
MLKVKMVLSIDTNAKTAKGVKYGYTTGILYLAPSDLSGYDVCPFAAVAGCKKACLNTAGRGVFDSVQKARIAKTYRLFNDYHNFMNDLAFSIDKVIQRAEKLGTTPVIRLNGTSDLLWELKHFNLAPETAKKIHRSPVIYKNLMELFPDVQFYDYTKIARRTNLPANYDLTFSYSGTPAYAQHVHRAVAYGHRIAVVFRNREDIPTEFLGRAVVDGDDSDLRFLDPKGAIVALYAKGPAKKDTTGFVVG